MKGNPKLTLAVAGAVLLGTLGVLGVLRYREVSARRQQLAGLVGQLGATDAAADRYRRASAEVKRLREEHRRFVQRVPYQPDLGLLLERVGQDLPGEAAEREIVTLPVVTGQHLNRTPIVLRFKGSAERVFAVLRHIEDRGLLTRVDRIRMEQTSPGSEQPLSVLVEFSLFSRSSEEALSCSIAE